MLHLRSVFLSLSLAAAFVTATKSQVSSIGDERAQIIRNGSTSTSTSLFPTGGGPTPSSAVGMTDTVSGTTHSGMYSSAGVGSYILRGLGTSTGIFATTPKSTDVLLAGQRSANGTAVGSGPASRAVITTAATLAAVNKSSMDDIPGLLTSSCADGNCIAVCSKNNTACFETAGSLAGICKSSWASYNNIRLATTPVTESGWSYGVTLEGEAPYTSTETIDVYTTFSAASASFVEDALDSSGNIVGVTTLTPVYAMGSPSSLTTVTTRTYTPPLISYLTGVTPTCKWMEVMAYTDCGQCTLTGGTVQLYYWPSTVDAATTTNSAGPQSTVLDGTTLYSPTVYISLQAVYAQNQCTQVGRNHTQTIISLNPTDVTTQIHIGGMVGQSGANTYGQLNYGDLTGLPPATQYEQQPSCIMFGCPTIYPSSSWDPTLVVPTQLRSIDPAWQSCAVGLEGLYDPPVALTAQAVMASVTFPTFKHTSTSASPSATYSTPAQQTTQTFTESRLQQSMLASSIAGILGSAEGARSTQTESPAIVASATSSTSSESPTTSQVDPKTNPDALSVLESALHPTTLQSATADVDPRSSNGAQASATAWYGDPSVAATIGQTLGIPGSDSSVLSGGSSVIAVVPSQVGGSSVVAIVQGESTSTVVPGSGATLGGQIISAPTSGGLVIGTGSTATTLHVGSAAAETIVSSNAVSGAMVSPASDGGFVVNGQTLAPGSAVTIGSGSSSITVSMLKSDSATYIALGTSTTVPLGTPDTPQAVMATYTAGSMTFTANADGGFAIGEATLTSGGDVIVGTGNSETTLSMAALGGSSAVVIGVTTTEILESAGSSETQSLPAVVTNKPSAAESSAETSGGTSEATTIASSSSGSLRAGGHASYFAAFMLATWMVS